MRTNTSTHPFFTVIIPTYNREKMIGKAVESVLDQSFTDLELIVVDDGSSDQTAEALAQITDSRLRVIKQENKGRSVARNTGIDSANGKFICFQDSDDIWLSEHLSNLHAVAFQLEEPSFLFTSLIWRFPDKDVVREQPVPSKGQSMVEYVVAEEVSTITVCISTSILKEFQFDPELVMNEDLHLWARIASKYPVVRVDSTQAIAIQHEENTQHLISDHISSMIHATQRIIDDPNAGPHLSKEFIRTRIMGFEHRYIDWLGQQDRGYEQSVKILRFLWSYPTNPQNKSKVVMLIQNLPIIGNLLKKK